MNLLSVGGSDPSGVAGIQRDARVAWAMGMHHLCTITAVTAQNTSGFIGVQPVDIDIIRQQLDAILSDFDISSIKVGMLWSSDIIEAVADLLEDTNAPIVLDPVVRSTTGGALLEDSALDTLLKRMVPLSDIVTPNTHEAERLTGITVSDADTAIRAAMSIYDMDTSAAVVTGIICDDEVSDVLYDGQTHVMRGCLLEGGHRGGGCTLSAIIACHMAAGCNHIDATRLARDQTYHAILESFAPGSGRRVAADPSKDLALAIARLATMPHTTNLIPECQTNFVHAAHDSVSPDQVLGIEGRLVRAGSKLVCAGGIKPGGSKHVASAVCAIRSKFPQLLSAANIRYSAPILAAMIHEGFIVVYYDRTEEPPDIKKSGSSVAWGVSEAVSKFNMAPDVICHRGDFGKEPMSIIFGTSPDDVVSKIERISDRIQQVCL